MREAAESEVTETGRRGGMLAGGALALALGATLFVLAPAWAVLLLALVVVWFAVPGVVLLRRLYGQRPGATGTALLLGGAWGFGLSSVMLLLLWVLGLRHVGILALAPALALAVLLPARRLAGALEPPRLGRGDLVAVFLVLLLVPLVVGRPYSQVGRDLGDGERYRAYFTADFVWKMAVVAEVSKGDVPPVNQFLHGSALHYYWLPHLLSSVEYRHLADRIRLDSLLLTNAVFLGLVFMAFLYGFTRQFVRSPTAAAIGCAGAVLLTSFEGFERLYVFWQDGTPFEAVRSLNIDAISRWIYGALPIDGLRRLLLYQPQHHAMAYAVGFSALLALVQAREPWRPAVMALAGGLLGVTLLLSAFSAAMIGVMVALYALVVLVTHGRWRSLVPRALMAAVAAAVPVGAAVGAAVALGYVDRSEGLLELGVNRMAMIRWQTTILLNFGPMLVAGLTGLAILVWRRRWSAMPLGILVAASFFFYFLVNVRDVQDVYVGWRAGHLLFMAFAPLAGVAVEELWARGGAVRLATLGLGLLLVLTGLPTSVIDLYNTQDIHNRAIVTPGRAWTIVLTPDELEALQWVRAHTPKDATIQVEPHVRHDATWAYIPAHAERRMSAGLPISMVPLTRYQAASAEVRALFETDTVQEAFDRAARLRIDYLFIGPPERAAYPSFAAMLASHPARFQRVFRNDAVSIYFVRGGPRGPLERDTLPQL